MSKEIMAVKKQARLENWAAEVESRTASGLTVQQWCNGNGMSQKTYYYHLRKFRENWLFLTSTKGAEASAMIYSIINTAEAKGLNTKDYLIEVFTNPDRLILPLKSE